MRNITDWLKMPTSADATIATAPLPIIPRITARLFIEKDNQYLYLLQQVERGGELSLPGGRVKSKEFTRKGLLREVLEETNLLIKKESLQFLCTLHRKEESEVEIIFFFKATIDNIDALAMNEPEKFTDFVWLPNTEISDNHIKEVRVALKTIQKGKFFSEFPKKKEIL
jgi:ADP-ribose pyrophosphatase YjhB (NUDIX family)